MKHRVALAGALAAVLVTTACSGGGSSSSSSSGSSTTTTTTTATAAAGAGTADPIEWTGTFCEGMEPAIEGVLALLKTMFEGGAENPAVLKAALLDNGGKAGKSLSEAGEKLKDLGAPSPESQALHDEVVAFFTDWGKTSAEFNTELAKLDPADPDFFAKLEQLGGDQTDPSKLQEQVKKLQADPKLNEAFKQAPQCVQMNETLKSLGS
ncbi:hypothetical protein ALI22I_37355 [Saccharothrix sp. ALI-22-I]|uniref:hypothetical protein n=1 Tax=Saccharothrix sp. ALI-22-I TaxID=1933778 RepID=UPI00097BB000|nr:hypothetical protein [Saccharothrix sp. ALI-22-I]ONI81867.1 hypothetical protein ALI22I_37355 [Saccharothrix sp. ALI-22-I]